MNKNKNISSILIVIFIIIIIVLMIYYFMFNNKLSSSNSSVNDIDDNVKLDTSDEEIDWSTYENNEMTLTKSITITEGGIYTLTGQIDDGLIKVNTKENVKLILNNVSITNSSGPAIYIESAESIVISTIEGTINNLNDSNEYKGYDDDVEGAIYSKDDLILEGQGTLIINGNKADAIVCKDDLKINNGTYIITSEDDGIRGKDSVYILDGNFTINSNGDGIKSTNDSDTTKGYIKIENGTFNINAKQDGIQAETKILISNGVFDITTGDGSSNSSDKSGWGNWGTSSDSAKGIKAKDNIIINDGTYTLNTSDDSIHSNNYLGITGGTYLISSGDDGIHADKELIVDNGTIEIQKSYEGMEAQTVTINDGNIKIVSSDDGLNAAGGNDSSALNRPGASGNINSSQSTLTINGGTIYVDASGDGLDANGSIFINGGTITVDGPTNDGNGALDYDVECKITGGTLIAAGASGMAQGISTTSSQYGVLINFNSTYSSGTNITITDSNDNEIITYTSTKSFSSVVFSSDNLSKETYTIKVNGESYQSFSINSISTTVGNNKIFGPNDQGRNDYKDNRNERR